MQLKIYVTCKATILIILSVILSRKITNGDEVEAINSFGIKSEVGKCNFKNGPNGLRQEYCYIENDVVPGLVKYFKDEQEKTGKKCKKFKLSDFDENSPSIMYGEASGRMGNQLLGYAMIYQLGVQLGVSTFMDYDMKEQLTAFFTPESINLPVLYDVYCNPEDIPWEMWRGRLADLLTDKTLRKGRFFWLYKPMKDGSLDGGYRPEDHLGPEQEFFSQAYVKHLQKNLKFYPRIQTRVNKALKKAAKEMKKKPKDITYVGIHNRRTDHMTFMKKHMKREELEELGVDFFMDGMDYFRDEYDNVAFIYASDDMSWGIENLKNVKDLHFLGAGQNLDKETQMEIVDPDAAAYDLALLVNCNHTIITRGTYTMWIAMLAGGEYYSEYGPIMPPDLM